MVYPVQKIQGRPAERYPLQRAFQFVEAVSRDLSEQLLKLLAGERLMVLEFEAFETVTSGCARSHGSLGGKISNILHFFANFWRARSRLYQNEILQENMRLTAFFKLYKICILLHRCNLKILSKNVIENQQFS